MQLTTFPFLELLFGAPSSKPRPAISNEIKGLQQELIELGRWLDSGACTADDEDSLKEAIVFIKNQIRELSCV